MTETLTWLPPTEPPLHRKRVLIDVGTPEHHAVVRGGWDAEMATWRDMDGEPILTAAVLGWAEWPLGCGA